MADREKVRRLAGFATYETVPGTYTRSNFYTASQDDKGHSARLVITVPPSVVSTMQMIVESRQFPALQTSSDIGRDAFVHRLRDYTEMTEDRQMAAHINRAIDIFIMLSDVEAEVRQNKALIRILRAIDTLRSQRGLVGQDYLDKMFSRFKDQADAWPPHHPGRRAILDKLEEAG